MEKDEITVNQKSPRADNQTNIHVPACLPYFYIIERIQKKKKKNSYAESVKKLIEIGFHVYCGL